ncbi:MAG: hypothetical protein E7616_04905 [Ruminococcaceae bacterium]|nr:hypothetical protein [Oscillospiraceae bacterium]
MKKQNKFKIILSCLIILLPALLGLLFFPKLNELAIQNWGTWEEHTSISGALLPVFLMPVILLPLQLLGLWITYKDNFRQGQSQKVYDLAIWILPVISLYASGITYTVICGMKLNYMVILCILFGTMFIIIGNYLPKCRQNHIIGIKTRWTLSNKENWNATHRFGSKVWLFTGFIFLLLAFFPYPIIIGIALPILVLIALLPALYSYFYYKDQLRKGTATKEDYARTTGQKIYIYITICILIPIFLILGIIMFTGNIQIQYQDDHSFSLDAPYWQKITVNYADIQEISYHEGEIDGHKINGFDSAKLMLGWFHNEKLGNHTRYMYARSSSYIVIKTNEKYLVISLADTTQTKALYETIQGHLK